MSRKLSKVKGGCFLVADCASNNYIYNISYTSYPGNCLSPLHNNGSSALFADGHVKWVNLNDFQNNTNNMWSADNATE